MAAITPDTILRESSGSMTLIIGKFTTAFNNADTWNTGLGTTIVSAVCNRTNTPTQTKEGVDAVNSSGTITLYTGENTVTADVIIWAKS